MKVALLSLGCRVNQAEIMEMEKALQMKGHGIVDITQSPDICIINTCTVTSRSDYQSRQLIRRAQKTGARVFVTGCYSELHKKDVLALQGVAAIIENRNKCNVINMIDTNSECLTSDVTRSRTRLFVKVQDGCNYTCSYCAIKEARGRSRSISMNDVISRVTEAVSEGYKEIIISGVHLGLYGKDLEPKASVSHLIQNILDKTNISRVRLGSLHIDEIDDALISLLKEQRVCKHLHIPLQSCDDETLRLMRRTYDSSLICERMAYLSSEIADIAIGTDLIAGFPTESQFSFENTLQRIVNLPFAYMHIFPYSRRPGTQAFHMRDCVGSAERKRRASLLRDLAEKKKIIYMDRHIGKTLDVLVEESASGTWKGTSGNYLKLSLKSKKSLKGEIVSARVMSRRGDMLFAKCVEDE